MGLFDFLKPQSTPLQKLSKDHLNALFPEGIFPGGQREMDSVAVTVTQLTNRKLTSQQALEIYGQAKIRLRQRTGRFDGETDFGPDADKLIISTINDSGGKLSLVEAASILHYLMFGTAANPLEAIERVKTSICMCYGSDSIGTDRDEMPSGVGEFGYEPTNPIPVRGIASSEIYLGRLRSFDGTGLKHERSGSLNVPNISGAVDEYQISKNGQRLCLLFINPYNRRISKLAPQGFLLVNG